MNQDFLEFTSMAGTCIVVGRQPQAKQKNSNQTCESKLFLGHDMKCREWRLIKYCYY